MLSASVSNIVNKFEIQRLAVSYVINEKVMTVRYRSIELERYNFDPGGGGGVIHVAVI